LQKGSSCPQLATTVRLGQSRGAQTAVAIAAGLLTLTGAAIPPAVTLSNHPGAAIIGLEPMVAQLLWAVPLGGLLALMALVVALRQRHWSNAAAALGGVMIATGTLLLGFAPWA
jgi:hypothetical protein